MIKSCLPLLIFFLVLDCRYAAATTLVPEASSVTLAGASPLHRPYPSPLIQLFRTKTQDNRRLIAAFLAFPLPVGFLGVHRIFLGTKPYIPVVYAGTLGGCLGLIPFVDFWVIVFSKDFDQYLDNPKFFMWIK
jgi:TM2 domain-containing membrane protein YozV